MKAVFTQYYKIESRERYASHGLHDRVIIGPYLLSNENII